MSTLEVKVTREVTEKEVTDMIFGTGGLIYPWWGNVATVAEGWRFRHDGEHSDEGALDVSTTVTVDQIAVAAGEYLTDRARDGALDGDHRDALNESLGYLDAEAADNVLQRAVLGKVVFG